MTWFENITGFPEADWASTRERLALDGEYLVSKVNGSRHRVGTLEVVTLQALRARRRPPQSGSQRTRVSCLAADVRALHSLPEFAGATFQVASQFNLLEMVGPSVTPEDGVTRYQHDRTQGPACAIAAGAGTIYRNYLVPVEGASGQTAQRQIDTLAPLGQALANRLALPAERLWTMQNGYALCSPEGLAAICNHLREASTEELDLLRGHLAVGIQRQVEVTDLPPGQRPVVTQVFCSALPIAYSTIAAPAWAPFATLVLEAAYEATLLAAAEQMHSIGHPTVLLTRLGGGAFGNPDECIDRAILRGLELMEFDGLDVRLTSYGVVQAAMRGIESKWRSGQLAAGGTGAAGSCMPARGVKPFFLRGAGPAFKSPKIERKRGHTASSSGLGVREPAKDTI